MASVRYLIRVGKCSSLLSENINKCGKPRWFSQLMYPQRPQWDRFMSTASTEEAKPAVDQAEESENEKKLRTELDHLSEKAKELDDKYKRALADGENMRKRLLKQIDDAKLFGIQGFCKDLLEVADILGKATESVPKEEVKDSNPHLKSLFEGLKMTDYELQKVFKRNGLVPVSPLDEKFNPNLHEALFQQEVAGKEPGTVVVVSKIGYKLHERVIRPALVGVAK